MAKSLLQDIIEITERLEKLKSVTESLPEHKKVVVEARADIESGALHEKTNRFDLVQRRQQLIQVEEAVTQGQQGKKSSFDPALVHQRTLRNVVMLTEQLEKVMQLVTMLDQHKQIVLDVRSKINTGDWESEGPTAQQEIEKNLRTVLATTMQMVQEKYSPASAATNQPSVNGSQQRTRRSAPRTASKTTDLGDDIPNLAVTSVPKDHFSGAIQPRTYFAPGRGITAKEFNKQVPGGLGQIKDLVKPIADALIKEGNPLGHSLQRATRARGVSVNEVLDALEAAFMTVGVLDSNGKAIPINHLMSDTDVLDITQLSAGFRKIATTLRGAARGGVVSGSRVGASQSISDYVGVPEVQSSRQKQEELPGAPSTLTAVNNGPAHYRGRRNVSINTGVQSLRTSIGHRKKDTEGADIGRGAQVAGFQTSQVFSEGREVDAAAVMDNIHRQAIADAQAGRTVNITHNGVQRAVPVSLVRGSAAYARSAAQLSGDTTARGKIGEDKGPLGVLQSPTAIQDFGNLYGAHILSAHLEGTQVNDDTLREFKNKTILSPTDAVSTGTSMYANRLRERMAYNREQERQKLAVNDKPETQTMRMGEIARIEKQMQVLDEIMHPDTSDERRHALVFPGQATKGITGKVSKDQALASMFGSELASIAPFEDIVATVAPHAQAAHASIMSAGLGSVGRSYVQGTKLAEFLHRLKSGADSKTLLGTEFDDPSTRLTNTEFETTGRESKGFQGAISEMFGLTNTATKGGTIWDSLFHASKAVTAEGTLKTPEELRAAMPNTLQHGLSSILAGSTDLRDIAHQGLPILDFAKLATSSNLNATQQQALEHLKKSMPELGAMDPKTLQKLADISKDQKPEDLLAQVAHVVAPEITKVIDKIIRDQATAAKMSSTEIDAMMKEHAQTGKVPAGFEGLFKQKEFWDPTKIRSNPEFSNALKLLAGIQQHFVQPGDTESSVMARMMGTEHLLTGAQQMSAGISDTDAAYGLQNRAQGVKEAALGRVGSNIMSRRYQALAALPDLEQQHQSLIKQATALSQSGDFNAADIKRQEAFAFYKEHILPARQNLGDDREAERQRLLRYQLENGTPEEKQKAIQQLALSENIKKIFGENTTFIGDEHGFTGTQEERYQTALEQRQLTDKLHALQSAPGEKTSARLSRIRSIQQRLAVIHAEQQRNKRIYEGEDDLGHETFYGVDSGYRVPQDVAESLKGTALGRGLVREQRLDANHEEQATSSFDFSRMAHHASQLPAHIVRQMPSMSDEEIEEAMRKQRQYEYAVRKGSQRFAIEQEAESRFDTSVKAQRRAENRRRRVAAWVKKSYAENNQEMIARIESDPDLYNGLNTSNRRKYNAMLKKANRVFAHDTDHPDYDSSDDGEHQDTIKQGFYEALMEKKKAAEVVSQRRKNRNHQIERISAQAKAERQQVEDEYATAQAGINNPISKLFVDSYKNYRDLRTDRTAYRSVKLIRRSMYKDAHGVEELTPEEEKKFTNEWRKSERRRQVVQEAWDARKKLRAHSAYEMQRNQDIDAYLQSQNRRQADISNENTAKQIYLEENGKTELSPEEEKQLRVAWRANPNRRERIQAAWDARRQIKGDRESTRRIASDYEYEKQGKGEEEASRLRLERLQKLREINAREEQQKQAVDATIEEAMQREQEAQRTVRHFFDNPVDEYGFPINIDRARLGIVLSESARAAAVINQDKKGVNVNRGDTEGPTAITVADARDSAYALAKGLTGYNPANLRRGRRKAAEQQQAQLEALSQPSKDLLAKYQTVYSPELLQEAQDTVAKLGGKQDLTTAEKRQLSAAQQRLSSHSIKTMAENYGDNSGVNQLLNMVMGMAPHARDNSVDAVHRAAVTHGVTSIMDQLSPDELEQIRNIDFSNTGSVSALLGRNPNNANFKALVATIGNMDVGKYARFGRKKGTAPYLQAQGIVDAAKQAQLIIPPAASYQLMAPIQEEAMMAMKHMDELSAGTLSHGDVMLHKNPNDEDFETRIVFDSWENGRLRRKAKPSKGSVGFAQTRSLKTGEIHEYDFAQIENHRKRLNERNAAIEAQRNSAVDDNTRFFDIETNVTDDKDPRKRIIYQGAVARGNQEPQLFYGAPGSNAAAMMRAATGTGSRLSRWKAFQNLAMQDNEGNPLAAGTVNRAVLYQMFRHAQAGGQILSQDELAAQMQAAIGNDSTVVGHNIGQFDLPTVFKGAVPGGLTVHDTLKMTQGLYPGVHQLGADYKALTGKDIANAHQADADVKANRELYQTLMGGNTSAAVNAYLQSAVPAAGLDQIKAITGLSASNPDQARQLSQAYSYFMPLQQMQSFVQGAKAGVPKLGLHESAFAAMQKMHKDVDFESMSAADLDQFKAGIQSKYLDPNMQYAVNGQFYPLTTHIKEKLASAGLASTGWSYADQKALMDTGSLTVPTLALSNAYAGRARPGTGVNTASVVPQNTPNAGGLGGNNGGQPPINNYSGSTAPQGPNGPGGNYGVVNINANIANVHSPVASINSGSVSGAASAGTTTAPVGGLTAGVQALQAATGLNGIFGSAVANQPTLRDINGKPNPLANLVNAAGNPITGTVSPTATSGSTQSIQQATIQTLSAGNVVIQVNGGNLTVDGQVTVGGTGFGGSGGVGGYGSRHSERIQSILTGLTTERVAAVSQLAGTNDMTAREAIQGNLMSSFGQQAYNALSGTEFEKLRRVYGLTPSALQVQNNPQAGLATLTDDMRRAANEKNVLEAYGSARTPQQEQRLSQINEVNGEMTQFIKLVSDLSEALSRTTSSSLTRPEYGFASTSFGGSVTSGVNGGRYNERIQSLFNLMETGRVTAAAELAGTNDRTAREAIQSPLISGFGQLAHRMLNGDEFANLRNTYGLNADVNAIKQQPVLGLHDLTSKMMIHSEEKTALEAMGDSRTQAQTDRLAELNKVNGEMNQFIQLIRDLSSALQKTVSSGLTRPEYGFAGTSYSQDSAAKGTGYRSKYGDDTQTYLTNIELGRAKAVRELQGENDQTKRAGIRTTLDSNFMLNALGALNSSGFNGVRSAFNFGSPMLTMTTDTGKGLQEMSDVAYKGIAEQQDLERRQASLTPAEAQRLEQLNKVNPELSQFIQLINDLAAALNKTTSAGATRPEYGYAGTAYMPGSGGTGSSLPVDRRGEMYKNSFEMTALKAMRNAYDQQGGILDVTGVGPNSTGYGSRDALFKATKDIGIMGQLNAGGHLQTAISEAKNAGLGREAADIENVINEMSKPETTFEELSVHLVELMHSLTALGTAAKGVAQSTTATTSEIDAATKTESSLGKLTANAQGAINEQRITSDADKKETADRARSLREGLQANAGKQSLFGGFSLEQRVTRERLLKDFTDRIIGPQNRDLMLDRGKVYGYNEQGKRIDLRRATDADLVSTQKYLKDKGVENISVDNLSAYRKALQEEEQTRNQSPMANPLQYVTNKVRDLQFWSQTIMNLPDTITSSIQQATSPALSALKTMTTARALSLSPETYKNALSAASQQQQLFGGSLSKNMQGVTNFIPIANAYGVDINKTVGVARKLAAFDPQQGMEGASLAIKEFLSGNVSSLSRRFEINRSALSKINTGDANQMMDSLNELLSTMGVTDRLLDEQANSLATKYDKMLGRLEMLKINMSAAVVNTLSGPLDSLLGPKSGLSRYLMGNQQAGALNEQIKEVGDDQLTSLKNRNTNLNTIDIAAPDFIQNANKMFGNANEAMLGQSLKFKNQTGDTYVPQLYSMLDNLTAGAQQNFKFEALLNQNKGMTNSQSIINAAQTISDFAGYQGLSSYRKKLGQQGYSQRNIIATEGAQNAEYTDKAKTEKVKVLKVIDADTVMIDKKDDKGKNIYVRTYGFDAAEKANAAGLAGKKRLEQQVEDSNGYAELAGNYGYDANGRLLSRMIYTSKSGRRFDSATDMVANGYGTGMQIGYAKEGNYEKRLAQLTSMAGDLGVGPVNEGYAKLGLGGLPEISSEAWWASHQNRYGLGSALGAGGIGATLGMIGGNIGAAYAGTTAISALTSAGGAAGLAAGSIPMLAALATAGAFVAGKGALDIRADMTDYSPSATADRLNEQLKIDRKNEYKQDAAAIANRGLQRAGMTRNDEYWQSILMQWAMNPGEGGGAAAGSVPASVVIPDSVGAENAYVSARDLVGNERQQRFGQMSSFAQDLLGNTAVVNTLNPVAYDTDQSAIGPALPNVVSAFEDMTNLQALYEAAKTEMAKPEGERNNTILDEWNSKGWIATKKLTVENFVMDSNNAKRFEKALYNQDKIQLLQYSPTARTEVRGPEQTLTKDMLRDIVARGDYGQLADINKQLINYEQNGRPTFIEEAKKYNDAAIEKRQQLRMQRYNNVMDYVGMAAYAGVPTNEAISSTSTAGERAYALTIGSSVDASKSGNARAIEENKGAAENAARNYAAQANVNKEQEQLRARSNAMWNSTIMNFVDSMRRAGAGFETIYNNMSGGDPNHIVGFMQNLTGIDYKAMMQQYQLLPGMTTSAATGNGLTGFNQVGPAVQFGYSQGPRGTMQYVSDITSNPTMMGQMNGGEILSTIMMASNAQTELVRRNIQQGHQMRDLAIQNARSIEDINRNAMISLVGIHRNYTNQLLVMAQQDEFTKRSEQVSTQELINTAPNLTAEQRAGFDAEAQTNYAMRNHLVQFNMKKYLRDHPEDTKMAELSDKLKAAGPEGSTAYEEVWKNEVMSYVHSKRDDLTAQMNDKSLSPEKRAELEKQYADIAENPEAGDALFKILDGSLRRRIMYAQGQATGQVQLEDTNRNIGDMQANRSDLVEQLNKTKDPKEQERINRQIRGLDAQIKAAGVSAANTSQALTGATSVQEMWTTTEIQGMENVYFAVNSTAEQTKRNVDENMLSVENQLTAAAINFNRSRQSMIQSWTDAAEEVTRVVPEKYAKMLNAISAYSDATFKGRVQLATGDVEGAKKTFFGAAETLADTLYPKEYTNNPGDRHQLVENPQRSELLSNLKGSIIVNNPGLDAPSGNPNLPDNNNFSKYEQSTKMGPALRVVFGIEGGWNPAWSAIVDSIVTQAKPGRGPVSAE